MKLSQPRIEVSVGAQTLQLWDGPRLVKQWACSTSLKGTGFQEGSNKTPVGAFRVAEKFGEGAALHTIFKGRKVVGEWSPGERMEEDLILARILWLDGGEARNANTKQRYVYIHGTNQERLVGQPTSHGCVRMHNEDVAELYEAVGTGTPVWINE